MNKSPLVLLGIPLQGSNIGTKMLTLVSSFSRSQKKDVHQLQKRMSRMLQMRPRWLRKRKG